MWMHAAVADNKQIKSNNILFPGLIITEALSKWSEQRVDFLLHNYM